MSSENSLGSNTKVICPPPVLEHPFTIWLSLISGATEYAIISLCVHVLSCVQLFAILWTIAHQAPLSMEFSRQEYWSRLPFPSPGDLPDPGIEHTSLVPPALAGGFFTHCTTWEALCDKFTFNDIITLWSTNVEMLTNPMKQECVLQFVQNVT